MDAAILFAGCLMNSGGNCREHHPATLGVKGHGLYAWQESEYSTAAVVKPGCGVQPLPLELDLTPRLTAPRNVKP